MLLSILTGFHVLLSLIGIFAGIPFTWGLLSAKQSSLWTSTFLGFTAATSITGFFFPVHEFLPSHAIGILSLIMLALSYAALYRFSLAGGWRATYVVTALLAFYFNCFVLVVQLFKHVPSLATLAPTQSEPPFKLAQLSLLIVFLGIGVLSLVRFRQPRVQTI